MKTVILVLLLAISAHAESRKSRLWHWSVAALAAGNVADATSSIGRTEGNPMLGSSFGARATAIKSGLVIGTIAFQVWRLRKHPEESKAMAIGNFVTGAALGGLAVRNSRLQH